MIACVALMPAAVVILILGFARMNETAGPWVLILIFGLGLLGLGGCLALSLLMRRGRAVARSLHGNKGLRAYRVRGGEAGKRLSQTTEQDYLLIRTTGVAAVFGVQEGRGPLRVEETTASELRSGELVLVEAGKLVPCDGEVAEGAAAIEEAAVTGVSWPVLREAGGPHSRVATGTFVVSGRMIVRVTG
jgi:high-affinity K+ transport system ATPase subunit B